MLRNKEYFRDKKISVVGIARSGLACANLLYELGADVSVTDSQDNEKTRLSALKLKSKDIKVELGRHTKEFIKDRDLIVISPGVDNNALPVSWADAWGIPIISEIEVGGILCPAKIIAVTGTNGKTTVTTLIGKILEAKGERAFVCGNIGDPFCGRLKEIRESDFVSLEVSSFQLERIKTFRPKISLVLNLKPNHLDRYKSMEEYLQAKKRIFMNQDRSDYLVLNSQDALVKELAKEARANSVFFSALENFNPNQSAVLTVGSILGIDKELCCRVFSQFKGVEHRLEYVAEVGGVEFINDSKSTNVDSTIWALKNIRRPVILIAGGRDKGCDYGSVIDYMRNKVKEIVLIGEAKKKIKAAMSGFLSAEESSTLEKALEIASGKALPGDCVLFSPMCSSFDMFSDYEERGRHFKRLVDNLACNRPVK